jgi:DNA modification methylase
LNAQVHVQPIIQPQNGKASAANNFPFHNWYNFVLGYTPQFPEYMLRRENITPDDLVADPFMGSGTTLIVCKAAGIPSKGIDANNFMVDAARTKLTWAVDLRMLKQMRDQLLDDIEGLFGQYRWSESESIQMSLFGGTNLALRDYQEIVARRPPLLLQKYLSDKPFARVSLIADAVAARLGDNPLRGLFDLALTSIIVPVSNIRYGPGFGVAKAKDDVDVLTAYASKLNRMIGDLENVNPQQHITSSQVQLGDARCLSEYWEANSIALMITSPPYPGDHEYTKHTKLELVFQGYAANQHELQTIKKRMIRASTTNLYKEDNDRLPIADMQSIQAITNHIQARLDEDGATSGFEKLYTKLVWEYFGGMYRMLGEALKVLRPGGKIALLVSDSHAFKMVHIETAQILYEIGLRLGYINPEIILWQHKTSTSHQYNLRENILVLQKPG